jgi:hypothetical protein
MDRCHTKNLAITTTSEFFCLGGTSLAVGVMVILGGLGSACGELEVWVPDLSGAATHSFECHRLFVKKKRPSAPPRATHHTLMYFDVALGVEHALRIPHLPPRCRMMVVNGTLDRWVYVQAHPTFTFVPAILGTCVGRICQWCLVEVEICRTSVAMLFRQCLWCIQPSHASLVVEYQTNSQHTAACSVRS